MPADTDQVVSAEATPRLGLPWTLSDEHKHPWRVECESNISGIKGLVCEVSYRPMAEQIITAVNSIDTLKERVAELEAALARSQERRRELSGRITDWQHHIDRVAKILGCFGTDEDVEAAVKKQAELIAELKEALDGMKQRTLKDGPCFCYTNGPDMPESYYENDGAATGHDNGFRHIAGCSVARAALAKVEDGGNNNA